MSRKKHVDTIPDLGDEVREVTPAEKGPEKKVEDDAIVKKALELLAKG